MRREWIAGALLVAAVFLYTRCGGDGIGSRVAPPLPQLSISSITSGARETQVTVRNHLSHPVRGEVDYIVMDGEYRSPSTVTPLLGPGEETTVTVEVRPEDAASGALSFRVRERLVYVDEANFDRTRVTPFSLGVGEP